MQRSLATLVLLALATASHAYVLPSTFLVNNDLAGPVCDTATAGRKDCGFYGITASECASKSCCWDPVSTPSTPWCFESTAVSAPPETEDPEPIPDGDGDDDDATCPAVDSQKRDCGFIGSTKESCEFTGCCWSPSTASNVPWCFYKNASPPGGDNGGGNGGGVYVPPTKEGWKKRSIYFVLTDRFAKGANPNSNARCTNLYDYCGGTFKGLEQNLDYITGMGFDAIWITPIVANAAKGYHGYHATDLYQVNPLLGTAQDLKDLVEACHRRNVWVMLDVVANHMAAGNIGSFNPFSSASDYHTACDINYNDQNSIEQCRIAGLPDLNTENSAVVDKLNNWVRDIVSEYKFDGIRIDTVKHVRKSFWPAFVQAAGVFTTGEVYNGDPNYVGDYTKTGGIDSVLNFPMYYTLTDVFAYQKSLRNIEYRRNQNGAYRDYKNLVNFVDNHDVKRFLNVRNDWALFKNALAYILTSDGIPCVYYGSEQGYAGGDDPQNRESLWPALSTSSNLYNFLERLNALRHQLGDAFYNSAHNQIFTEDSFHVFQRGSVIIVVNNLGSGRSLDRTISTPSLAAGSYKDIFTGTVLTVANGQFTFNIRDGQPLVLLKV